MNSVVRLSPQVANDLTYQSYEPQPTIEGVFYHPLTIHRGLEGWFAEYFRLSSGEVEGLPRSFEVRQISFSRAVSGRINAFHVHPKVTQDELWSVVDGDLMVWLVDCREGSTTLGVKRKYVLSAEAPALLYIPSGVAHGYKAGDKGALLVYAMNNQFNVKDPNEGRLPWNYFGPALWEDDRG